MKAKVLYVSVGVLLGIVLAPQIQKLPLVNKIPQV
jgi:hypothetical protein